MSEFFSMGGYGAYVWTSYLVALIVVVWNVWVPVQARRAAMRSAGRRTRSGRA